MPSPPTEVLLVEDSAGDALLARQILAEAMPDVRLRIVRDGVQALMLLADSMFHPALVILDLNLPGLSGFDVLAHTSRGEIPIVVFTSSANPADRERALARGVKEYVQKPLDLEGYRNAVLQMVRNWAIAEGTGRSYPSPSDEP